MDSTTSATIERFPEAEARRLRSAFGMFPTGVVIVTAWDRCDGPLGMTMNSFTSLSLEPPLALFSIHRAAAGLPGWRRAEGYAVNVLAADQEQLSAQFARPLTDKWRGVEFEHGLFRAPLIAGSIAYFECSPHEILDAGDHLIFIVRIARFSTEGASDPLVFHRGRYCKVADRSNGADSALPSVWPLSIHY